MEIKNSIIPFEIKNSAEWPNVFSCRFLEDGIVSYKDMEDGGIAYLTNETIQKMVATFIGKPVCVDHQKITAENYEELRQSGVIVGNVIRIWKNPEDGWWWCDFLVDTEAGRQRIKNYKDKVSCAYKVLETKEGGLWHDIPYDAEITDGSFTHLALVENPRYEGSIIREQFPEVLCNGKAAFIITYREDNHMNVIEFLKNVGNKKEKMDLNVVINGKEMPLSDVLETLMDAAVKNSKTPADAPKEMEIGGKKYTMEDIVNGFKKFVENGEKKNCNCNAKEGADHKSDCPMYENKKMNDKGTILAAAKLKNEKDRTPEEKAMIEEEEKEITESKNKKDGEMKNAKDKELNEFFNKLTEMANKVPAPEELLGDAPAPRSRTERANAFSDLVKKNMGKK